MGEKPSLPLYYLGKINHSFRPGCRANCRHPGTFFIVKTHLNRLVFLISLILLLPATGLFYSCASNTETLRTQQDLARLESDISQLKKEIKQQENSGKSASEQNYALLQSQIDAATSELKAVDAKTNDTIQRLNDIDQKISLLEKKVKSLNEQINNLEKKGREKPKTAKIIPIQNDVSGTVSNLETIYDDAYYSFTQGDYTGARKKFEAFLKRYPETAYSDNARFWIGETYYSEGDFESAILEYEKVIRKYPMGDKVPSALLKEGLAFIKLGDKTDGKLALRKLVKKYPRTDQARIARRIIGKLK